jgi:proteasome accessory factor C
LIETAPHPEHLSERITRLIALLPWLAANPDASADEVADRFQVSEEQVMQDVLLLTMTGPNQYGGGLVDIAYDSRVLTVRDAKGLASPVVSEPKSLYPLILGLEVLAAAVSGPELDVVHRLSNKLKQAANISTSSIGAVTTKTSSGEDREGTTKLRHAIDEAIKSEWLLEFSYQAPDAGNTKRRVVAKSLGLSDGVWYLSAWDIDKQDERVFRLDRMSDLRASERQQSDSFKSTPPSSADELETGQDKRFILTLKTASSDLLEDFPSWQLIASDDQYLKVGFPNYREDWALQTTLALWPWLIDVDPPELKTSLVARITSLKASHRT